jgi:anti-anti-sigma regulatory factor
MPEIATPELPEPGRVSLGGALTVRNAEEIRSRLLDALRQHPTVRIDCTAATDVDLSFIQLVLSARKSAAATGKCLSLTPPATDVLSDALVRAGLLGAADDKPVDRLFWLNKDTVDGEDHSHRR